VVPTWNYSVVHLRGPVTVHDDPDWLREAVTRLTDRHETRTAPEGDGWQVTDAPERFVTGQLRAIVGVSMRVTQVEAKVKHSQNRSAADQHGVVDGLRDQGDADGVVIADAIERRLTAIEPGPEPQ
jgi:transcriptional regulator